MTLISVARNLALSLFLVPVVALADDESTTRVGEYTIHHNAIKTDFLTPEVAGQYGIPRSKYRGMVNICLKREVTGQALGETLPARVEIQASDLMQKPKNIELREVREGDAIYYIGDFPVIDRELVNFRVRIYPEGSDTPLNARFSHEFYVD